MPATTIQSRISAFEALSSPSFTTTTRRLSPSPPIARKTSLIDLQEWVVDDGPNGRTPTQPQFDNVAPLIQFESPPLPPRKPSHTSLKSVASSTSTSSRPSLDDHDDHTYPPLQIDVDYRSRNSSGHAPASSISSFHSVSLSSEESISSTLISTFETDSVSLDESYEEVSTPSIMTPATTRNISLDWEKAMAKRNQVPPKLPRRPSASPTTPPPPKRHPTPSSAPTSPRNASLTRKPPPPPPSRSSDRSSIKSTTTSYSISSSPGRSLKIKRPTPVPPAARVRYEIVFDANVVQQRRAEKQKATEKPALLSPEQARGTQRRAAGWRGLSVDLITGGQSAEDIGEGVGPTDRLEGHLVKTIWRRSRLGRRTLAEIWHECDPNGTGSLTRDQFAKGMWRIDEELRRAQVQALKSTSTGSLGSLRSNGRSPFKPPPAPKSKLILR